jgi:hypothetical protein
MVIRFADWEYPIDKRVFTVTGSTPTFCGGIRCADWEDHAGGKVFMGIPD